MARSIPLVATLVALLLFSGCQEAQSLLGELRKPTVKVVGVSLEAIDLGGATVNADLSIKNPYTVALPVAAVDYALEAKGATFLTGRADDAITVPAGESAIYPVSMRLSFDSVRSIVPDVRLGTVIPYAADLGIFVDAPGLGITRLPLRHEGELPVPAPPKISLDNILWESVSLERVSAVLYLDVTNPNEFSFDLLHTGCEVALGGSPIADAYTSRALSLEANGDGKIEVPFAFFPIKAGVAIVQMIAGSGASYRLEGTFEGTTPFGAMALPFTSEGETTFRR